MFIKHQTGKVHTCMFNDCILQLKNFINYNVYRMEMFSR